jgi:hypothetical protein
MLSRRSAGWHHTVETRAKLSAAKVGCTAPNKGKRHTTEARAKMSASQFNRPGPRSTNPNAQASRRSRARKRGDMSGSNALRTTKKCGPYNRTVGSDGYVHIQFFGLRIREHVIVWIQAKGPIPKGKIVHHENEIRDDNRIENLRCMTPSEHTQHHAQQRLARATADSSCPI